MMVSLFLLFKQEIKNFQEKNVNIKYNIFDKNTERIFVFSKIYLAIIIDDKNNKCIISKDRNFFGLIYLFGLFLRAKIINKYKS